MRSTTITDEMYADFEDACSKAEMVKISELLHNHGNSIAQRYALHAAAKSGQMNVVHTLLGIGINNNGLDVFEWSAMHYAAYRNRVKALACFCEEFPHDIEKRTGSGLFHGQESLLHIAARGKATEALKYLIEKKYFDVNVRDQNNDTALHWAIKMQARGCALLLIANGADIHARNSSNRTPFDAESKDESESTRKFKAELLRIAENPAELANHVNTAQSDYREFRFM